MSGLKVTFKKGITTAEAKALSAANIGKIVFGHDNAAPTSQSERGGYGALYLDGNLIADVTPELGTAAYESLADIQADAQTRADAAEEAAIAAIQADATELTDLSKVEAKIDEIEETQAEKVTQVSGGNGISVTGTKTNREVAVDLYSGTPTGRTANAAEIVDGKLYVPTVVGGVYSIQKATTPDAGYTVTYRLTKDGVPVGDAINFKDAVVSSGEVRKPTAEEAEEYEVDVNKVYIILTLANAEKTKLFIEATSLIDIYLAGTATSLRTESDGTHIDVNVAEATTNVVDADTTNKNFLKVNADNALEVKGVDADAAVTTDVIPVAGGPVSITTANWPSTWKDESGNCIIPSNVSIQDVLTNLFLKKIDGTLGNPTYTWNPALTAPTVSLNNVSGSVEVGTTATVVITPSSTINNNTAVVECTSTQGYFVGDSTTWKSGKYTESKAGGSSGTAAYTDATFNSVATTPGAVVTIKDGTNTLSAKGTGITATAPAAFTECTLYASTNTKQKVDPAVTKNIVAQGYTGKSLTSAAATVSVTGVRKMFAGSHVPKWSTEDLTSDNVRGLGQSKAKATGEWKISINEGAWQVVIAVPSTVKVTSVKDEGAFGTELIDKFTQSTTSVQGLNNYSGIEYKVYMYTVDSPLGANTYDITVANA